MCAVTTHLGQTGRAGWRGDDRGVVVPSPAAEEPQRAALLARVRAALERRRISFKYITMVTRVCVCPPLTSLGLVSLVSELA